MSQSANFQQKASAWQAALEGDATGAAAALATLKDVNEPALLHLVSKALDNQAAVGRRRVADLAVEAITDRLQLPVSFPRTPDTVYRPEQVDEVKRLLRSAIPS